MKTSTLTAIVIALAVNSSAVNAFGLSDLAPTINTIDLVNDISNASVQAEKCVEELDKGTNAGVCKEFTNTMVSLTPRIAIAAKAYKDGELDDKKVWEDSLSTQTNLTAVLNRL